MIHLIVRVESCRSIQSAHSSWIFSKKLDVYWRTPFRRLCGYILQNEVSLAAYTKLSVTSQQKMYGHGSRGAVEGLLWNGLLRNSSRKCESGVAEDGSRKVAVKVRLGILGWQMHGRNGKDEERSIARGLKTTPSTVTFRSLQNESKFIPREIRLTRNEINQVTRHLKEFFKAPKAILQLKDFSITTPKKGMIFQKYFRLSRLPKTSVESQAIENSKIYEEM